MNDVPPPSGTPAPARQPARPPARTRRQQQIRRRRLAAAVLAALLLAFVLLVALLVHACGGSQGDVDAAASGRSPSPSPVPTVLRTPTKADPLRFAAYGESVGESPVWGIWQRTQTDKDFGRRVKLHYFTKPSSGLSRPDFFDWTRYLRRDLAGNKYEAVMFMTGANDAQDVKVNGIKYTFGTKAWDELYQTRVAEVMDLILDKGAVRLYWVGMPRMGLAGFGPKMARLNGIYRKEAEARAPQVVYVDLWKLLDGAGGTYRADLRQGDGVHLSDAGAFRSGDVILRQIRRDWHLAQ